MRFSSPPRRDSDLLVSKGARFMTMWPSPPTSQSHGSPTQALMPRALQASATASVLWTVPGSTKEVNPLRSISRPASMALAYSSSSPRALKKRW